jgi:hypothetical protein
MHDVATHDDSKGQYFWVWGALLVLTGDRSGARLQAGIPASA